MCLLLLESAPQHLMVGLGSARGITLKFKVSFVNLILFKNVRQQFFSHFGLVPKLLG